MSSSTPPSGEPEYLELGHQPGKGPRRGLALGVVAGVVAALVLPLSGFAIFRLLSGGGTQPHDVLPGNAVGYFRLDLDPSAPQKIEALGFLRTFPAFEKYTKITDDNADVREVIVDAMLDGAPCRLDYEQDVAPWLGERVGVAVMAPQAGDTEPTVVGALQVTDEQAADEGLRKLKACDDGGEPVGGWSYLDGYMVLAETRQQAADFAAAAARTPLADNEQFRADMDRLGEQGVASLWFSGEGVYQAFSSAVTGDPGPAGAQLDLMRDQVRRQMESAYHSGAVAFRFDDSYVELATVLTGDAYHESTSGRVADMALPETTAVAVGIADGAQYVDEQSDAMLSMLAGPGTADPDRVRRQVEKQLGLRLPQDLKALLGDNFTLAVDGADLGKAMGANPAALDVGARATTDTDAFRRVVRTLEGAAARSGVPLRLVVEDTEDGAAVALNRGYATELADGGPLADTIVFDTAVADADEAQSVLFVNVDVLEDAILGVIPPLGREAQHVIDNVTKLEAVGVSSTVHDGYSEGAIRITVGE